MDDISGPSSAFGASYLYRTNGDVNRATFHPSGQSLLTYDYGYDGLQRLTSADFGPNGLTGAYDLEVTHDKNGNIETLKRRDDAGDPVDDLVYTYGTPRRNQLQGVSDNGVEKYDATGNRYTWDARPSTLDYDDVGNLTSFSENDPDDPLGPYVFSNGTYDERNLLTSFTREGVTTQYRYSLGGQRTYKQNGANDPEYYVLDGATTLAVVTGSTLDYWNVTLPSGEVIGRHLAGGDRRYYLKDHIGSVRVVVDGSGTVKETRDYYPFGLPMPGRITTEATPAKEDFTGHERDSETGLHYAGARYHMSALGRWTTTDPILREQGPKTLLDRDHRLLSMSPYNYGFGNPVTLTDPDGRMPCCFPILWTQETKKAHVSIARTMVEVASDTYGDLFELATGRTVTGQKGDRLLAAAALTLPAVSSRILKGGKAAVKALRQSRYTDIINNAAKGGTDALDQVVSFEKGAKGKFLLGGEARTIAKNLADSFRQSENVVDFSSGIRAGGDVEFFKIKTGEGQEITVNAYREAGSTGRPTIEVIRPTGREKYRVTEF